MAVWKVLKKVELMAALMVVRMEHGSVVKTAGLLAFELAGSTAALTVVVWVALSVDVLVDVLAAGSVEMMAGM